MSDNGSALLGRLRRVNATAAQTKLIAVLREEEGVDLPVIEIDPTDAGRLRMIPAIGAGGGAIPGTRPDKAAEQGLLDVPERLRDRAHELAHEGVHG